MVSLMYISGRTECNAQLEGEGTGKGSGQENGVLADEGPKYSKECLR
jgi:hypothetical protein